MPMHSQRVIVCYGFWSGGIFSQFFLENYEESYRVLLTDCIFSETEAEDIDDIWFQKNAAKCRKAHATIGGLRPTFENRVIRKNYII